MLAISDQKVGEPDEAAVEHRGLVHHRRGVGDGSLGGRGGRAETGDRVCRTAHHRHRVAELLAQRLELAALVLVTQSGGAGEQVVLDGDARTPAKPRVEIPQQGVLTASGGREVRRAVDDAVACHEHSSNCRRAH